MRPRACRPWRDPAQILAESKFAKLVLEEFPDVPRQVVVSVVRLKEKKKLTSDDDEGKTKHDESELFSPKEKKAQKMRRGRNV